MPSRRCQDPHATAVAVVMLPSARHAGAASGEKQFQHTPSSRAPCQTEIHQIKKQRKENQSH